MMPVVGRHPRVAMRAAKDRLIRAHVAAGERLTLPPAGLPAFPGVGPEEGQLWFVDCLITEVSSLETLALGQPQERGCVPLTPWLSCTPVQRSTYYSWGTHHHHPKADITATSSGQGSWTCDCPPGPEV